VELHKIMYSGKTSKSRSIVEDISSYGSELSSQDLLIIEGVSSSERRINPLLEKV
jgi:hypothetical protein